MELLVHRGGEEAPDAFAGASSPPRRSRPWRRRPEDGDAGPARSSSIRWLARKRRPSTRVEAEPEKDREKAEVRWLVKEPSRQPESPEAPQGSVRWLARKPRSVEPGLADSPEQAEVRWLVKERAPEPEAEKEAPGGSGVRWLVKTHHEQEPEAEAAGAEVRWIARKRAASGAGRPALIVLGTGLAVVAALLGSLAVRAVFFDDQSLKLAGNLAQRAVPFSGAPASARSADGGLTQRAALPSAGEKGHEADSQRGVSGGASGAAPSGASPGGAFKVPLQQRPETPGNRTGPSASGQGGGKTAPQMPEGNANGVKRAKGEKGLVAGGGKVGKGSKTLEAKKVRGSKRGNTPGAATDTAALGSHPEALAASEAPGKPGAALSSPGEAPQPAAPEADPGGAAAQGDGEAPGQLLGVLPSVEEPAGTVVGSAAHQSE